MTTIDTQPTEMFAHAEVSADSVRLMVLNADRKLLLMWDMTREQAGTLTAMLDGRLHEFDTEDRAT